jgi:hypothetical protein
MDLKKLLRLYKTFFKHLNLNANTFLNIDRYNKLIHYFTKDIFLSKELFLYFFQKNKH